MSLKLIEKKCHGSKEDSIVTYILTYEGFGYIVDFKILKEKGADDYIDITFTGTRGVYQPGFNYANRKIHSLNLSGICFLEDLNLFIQNVTDAKALADFINKNFDKIIMMQDN